MGDCEKQEQGRQPLTELHLMNGLVFYSYTMNAIEFVAAWEEALQTSQVLDLVLDDKTHINPSHIVLVKDYADEQVINNWGDGCD